MVCYIFLDIAFSLYEFHQNCRNFFLSILFPLGIYTFGLFATDIFVNAGQVVTGNLAPHFLALCKPNYTALGCQQFTQFISGAEACSGNPELIMKARKTFPSKDAALSIYAATYLAVSKSDCPILWCFAYWAFLFSFVLSQHKHEAYYRFSFVTIEDELRNTFPLHVCMRLDVIRESVLYVHPNYPPTFAHWIYIYAQWPIPVAHSVHSQGLAITSRLLTDDESAGRWASDLPVWKFCGILRHSWRTMCSDSSHLWSAKIRSITQRYSAWVWLKERSSFCPHFAMQPLKILLLSLPNLKRWAEK